MKDAYSVHKLTICLNKFSLFKEVRESIRSKE